MTKIAVVGHVTKDVIDFNGRREEKIGGTAFYSGITLGNLGIKTRIFTKLSAGDKGLLDALKHKNISLFPSYCRYTTCFLNAYAGEKREQFVNSVAEPFSVKDLKGIEKCGIAHIGPLTRKDIPLEILKYLKSAGITTSLDVQGYLRRIRKRRVLLADWKDKKEFLKYTDIIKADRKEANILTGRSGKKAAEALAKMGPTEVVITDGRNGSLVYSKAEDKHFVLPAFKPSVSGDVTGCGDTYIAAYIARRFESDDLKECGLFAARCATAKIEKGVFV